MAFPPPPSSTIDWANIGLEFRQVNGHVESIYHAARASWSQPKLVLDPILRVHGLSPGLNYGQQAFEGLKAFRDPTGEINIFRPIDHARRMNHSNSFANIPNIPEEHFLECVQLAVATNAAFVPPHTIKEAALYIRPLAFGSAGHLSLSPCTEYTFCVFVQPLSAYHGTAAADALVLEDFDRAAPRGTGAAKVGGNYAPVQRWSEAAKKEGFGITLHLDSQTRTEIDEFSTAGFIGVQRRLDTKGGFILAIPDSSNVIKSITSRSCTALAERFGWDVQTRTVLFEELPLFNEVIAVGTAAALVPIRSITRKSTNDEFQYDTTGETCCAQLLGALQGIQRGIDADTFEWCERNELTSEGTPEEKDGGDDGRTKVMSEFTGRGLWRMKLAVNFWGSRRSPGLKAI